MRLKGNPIGSSRARCNTSPLAIVVFRLAGLQTMGSVPVVLKACLDTWFINPANLQFHDIEFNLQGPDDVEPHAQRVEAVVDSLRQ